MSIEASDQPSEPPLGWGKSELTKHFEAAYKNRRATFVNNRKDFQKLREIDDAFLVIAKDWLNPDPLVSANMFLRSHSAYRAACDIALATELPEALPVIRVSIEYAAYALHIAKKPGFDEVWLRG